MRVNAQLIDAELGAHLWAEKFDTARGDLLDMQDEIVTRVARALHIKLSAVEAARLNYLRPKDQDADMLAMQAESEFLAHGVTGGVRMVAYMRLCEQVLERDPNNIRALTILGLALAVGVWSGRLDLEVASRAAALTEHALTLAPNHYMAHHSRSVLLMVQQRHQEAIAADERALQLNPGYVGTYTTLAYTYGLAGNPLEGIRILETAIRLSPRDPLMFSLLNMRGILHFMLGNDQLAVDALSQAVGQNPNSVISIIHLAALLALNGRMAEAKECLARPATHASLPTISGWRARETSRHLIYLAYRERLYDGLRKAGMPER